jgi:hypothetical protein
LTAEVLVIAQVKLTPALIALTPEVRPLTETGVGDAVVQHFTAPATSAHECEGPVEIAVTPVVSPET